MAIGSWRRSVESRGTGVAPASQAGRGASPTSGTKSSAASGEPGAPAANPLSYRSIAGLGSRAARRTVPAVPGRRLGAYAGSIGPARRAANASARSGRRWPPAGVPAGRACLARRFAGGVLRPGARPANERRQPAQRHQENRRDERDAQRHERGDAEDLPDGLLGVEPAVEIVAESP